MRKGIYIAPITEVEPLALEAAFLQATNIESFRSQENPIPDD